MVVFVFIVLVIMAYLLGSIPTAVWIGRKYYGIDVREHGSKNAGTTNTLRVLGKRAAIPVFAVDIAKGAIAVLLVKVLFLMYPEIEIPQLYLEIVFAVVAVIGHMVPVFARFKGGKGVATITGAMFAIAPLAILCSLLTFFVILLLFNYVSLASMLSGIAFPIYLRFLFNADSDLVTFGVVIALALIYTHRKNIKRLLKGEEGKIMLVRPKGADDDKPQRLKTNKKNE